MALLGLVFPFCTCLLADEIYIPADWQIFKDKAYGYQLHYPPTWKVTNRAKRKQMIRGGLTSKDGKSGFQIRAYQKRCPFKRFVKSYLKRFKSDMSKHWKGTFTAETISYEKIGKHQGCVIELGFQRGDGRAYHFMEFLWHNEDRVVAFQCGTPMSTKDEMSALLYSIAETFSFVERS